MSLLQYVRSIVYTRTRVQVHSIMYVRMHVLVSVAGPLSLSVSMYVTLETVRYAGRVTVMPMASVDEAL